MFDSPQPDKVATSTWQLQDFFLLSEIEEVSVKKQIASKRRTHYGNASQDKPCAEDYGGIKAYTVEGITAAREAFLMPEWPRTGGGSVPCAPPHTNQPHTQEGGEGGFVTPFN